MMRTDPLEATVAGHTIRHLAGLAYTQPGRAAAPAAAALIDALHTRAQQRAERRLRSDTAFSVRPRRTLNAVCPGRRTHHDQHIRTPRPKALTPWPPPAAPPPSSSAPP